MSTGTTHREEGSVGGSVLHLALELDEKSWKLAFTTGLGRRPWLRQVGPREVAGVLRAVEKARKRFGLGRAVRVVSCYEAGRQAFWLHRWLVAEGIENHVVDSASIEVNRRARRAKSDRLDATKLVTQLVRYEAGERTVWSVVRVPTVEEEDARHLHRELGTLKRDRTRLTNRIKGLLATQGVRLPVGAGLPGELEAARLWDGRPLPPGLKARVERTWERRQALNRRIRALEAERRALMQASSTPMVEQVRRLMKLRGIGENSAWLFVTEAFGWREFRNRREVAGYAGLTPTPYQSGSTEREQGISKAGNKHLRWMAVQVAWAWLRYQPDSELTRWYRRKFDHSRRTRKIGIVALARRILVELWRYLETGVVPEGAVLKA